jgi:flagellar basal-body rod protein FlgB
MAVDNQIFGIHEKALNVHLRRAEIIAHNLANDTTPGYQAKDINFKLALQEAMTSSTVALNQTHKNHLSLSKRVTEEPYLEYRKPLQHSLDGNTVDSHVEHAAYAENTLRYLANITFMNHRLQTLNMALSAGG